MKTHIILGIDPGIANAALAVVAFEKHGYTLDKVGLVKSTPKQVESIRLLKIYETVYEILDELDIDALVAIEKVFHNKNVSSSITTGKAIGAAITAVAQHDIPVIELTPQQIKAVSGFGGSANKAEMLKVASGIFKTQIKSHHTADASLCVLGAILQHRIPQLEGREPQEHRTRLRYNRESPDSIAERQPRRVRTP